MRKGGNNKQYKLSKLFSLLLILIIATTDVAPLVSVAVDTIKEDKETVEEITGEDEKGEDLELEIEDGDLEGDDIELEDGTEEGYGGEENIIEVPERSEYGVRARSMGVQSTNNYVLAKESDFTGTNGSFKYVGKDDYVEVPHTIRGEKVTSYYRMFEGTSVKGVKSTNKNITDTALMFYNLQSEELDVSQLDTTNVANMYLMFSARSDEAVDTKLKRLDLSNFYTGKVINMREMFRFSSVEELDLSNFDTSNVINMLGMFRKAKAKTLDLRSFDTSKVINFSQMFMNVKSTKVDVSSFDTSRATHMNYMFGSSVRGWNTLRELDISNFDTTNVVDMEGMFKGSLVTTLDLSNFNTSQVKTMGMMFRDSSIKNLDLTSFDTSNVVAMNDMFYGSFADTINVSSFDTTKVPNMNGMFQGVRAKNIDIRNFDTSNVEVMRGMFRGSHIEQLDLSSFNTSKVTSMLDMFRDAQAIEINLESFDTSNVTDMGFMFNNSKVNKLDLSHFDTSNVQNMGYMFTGSKVNILDVSNFDTRNVDNMDEMFRDINIQNLDLRSFNTQRITNMNRMFRGATAQKLDVSNFDTSYVLTMEEMFKDSNIEGLDLRSFDMGGVNKLDGIFGGTKATKGISRTQEDSVKLEKYIDEGSTLHFTPFYAKATDEDFIGFYNGNFRYTGTKEYVEVPHTIKGTPITSYENLFENTSVKGVISTNSRVTTMKNMFKGNQSERLDIRTLNTENVRDMSGMFQDTKTKELDLRGFRTTEVESMNSMFRNTNVDELDLGSFDTSKVKDLDNMFTNTKSTVGYARTREDLNKLTGSVGKPTTLEITIWGIITEQTTEEWTNGNVDINIKAVSDLRDIKFVEMINEPGRNLLRNTHVGNTGMNYQGLGVTRAVRNIESGFTDTYSVNTINPPLGDTYTLSFYARSSKPTSMNTHFYNPNTTIKVKNSQGRERNASDGHSQFDIGTEWERYWVTYTQTPSSTTKSVIVGRIFGVSDIEIAGVKLEEGDVATPWTPAPEDSSSSGDQQGSYSVFENGTYVFRATDTTGNTKTVSHTVTNIDRDIPQVDVTPLTTGWTSQDVTLQIKAGDELSGVDYITLPDGEKVYDKEVMYTVKENGIYTIKVTDKAGNIVSVTEEVKNIDRSVPKVNADVVNKGWTREDVKIKVYSEDTRIGVKDIISKEKPKGYNILRNTSNMQNTENWMAGRGTIGVTTLDYWKDGKEKVLYIENTNRNEVYLYSDRYELKPNTEYTISMMAGMTSNTSSLDIYMLGITEEGVGNEDRKYNINLNYTSRTRIVNRMGKVEWTFKTPSNIKSGYLRIDNNGSLDANASRVYLADIKLEEGIKATPYEKSIDDDINLEGNSKTYTVKDNGNYTFQTEFNNGLTSDVSVNVTNIDKVSPEVTITGNPEDWTEDDEVELTVNVKDGQSGVKEIILPDGRKVQGDKVTYKVVENGDYTFKVIDNVGNETTVIERVEHLMVRYYFYIKNGNNEGIEGAEFTLYRDGKVFKITDSGKDGLVDFGKVPPNWNYTVRQTKAPDGYIVDTEEKDIDVGDESDPIEIINYPRGTVMPSTGTVEIVTLTVIITGLITVIAYIVKKKRAE